MNERELFSKLKVYANFVVSELNKWEKEERLHMISTPVNLDREHPEKVAEYRAAVRVISRNFWDYLESQTFIQHIHSSPIAKETMTAIIEFPPRNQSMFAHLLNFTQALMDSKIGLVKCTPIDLARNLAAYLSGSAITRHLIAKIHGIEVKESIKIGKEIILRPATEDDDDWEKKGYMRPFYENILWGSPDSVIEIKAKVKQCLYFQAMFYRLFHTLQLYRPHPIGSSHAVCWSASPIDCCRPHSSALYVGRYVNTSPRYLIDDVDDFVAFIKKNMPLLPRNWIEFNIKFDNPLNIAYNRYLEALQNYQQRTRAITFAVMGLEALILEGGSELAHKFRSRLARLSSYIEFRPKEVYEIMNQAYSIRSNFVHGSVTKPSKNEKLCMDLSLSLLQICILIYFSNGSSFKKKGFLNYIDNAIIGLDVDGETEIVKIIKKYKRIR